MKEAIMFDLSKAGQKRGAAVPWTAACVATVARKACAQGGEISQEEFLKACTELAPAPKEGARDVRRQVLMRAIKDMVKRKTFPMDVVGRFFVPPSSEHAEGLDLI
jgi:hypothetical protein